MTHEVFSPGKWQARQLEGVTDSIIELRGVRDALIRELKDVYGWSLRSIAVAARLSHTQIANILEAPAEHSARS